MGRAFVRRAARRDLIRHFAWIGESSSLETARRFRDAARRTFKNLAQNPGMGAPRRIGRFTNLRMWRVDGFEKYLIFYQQSGTDVVVERVVHAAQDYNRVLSPSA